MGVPVRLGQLLRTSPTGRTPSVPRNTKIFLRTLTTVSPQGWSCHASGRARALARRVSHTRATVPTPRPWPEAPETLPWRAGHDLRGTDPDPGSGTGHRPRRHPAPVEPCRGSPCRSPGWSCSSWRCAGARGATIPAWEAQSLPRRQRPAGIMALSFLWPPMQLGNLVVGLVVGLLIAFVAGDWIVAGGVLVAVAAKIVIERVIRRQMEPYLAVRVRPGTSQPGRSCGATSRPPGLASRPGTSSWWPPSGPSSPPCCPSASSRCRSSAPSW